MPRRQASSMRGGSTAPAARPQAIAPTVPAQQQPTAALQQPQQQQQPGLFAQMATTAAGVAVGSAVGHTLGAAVTSAFSGGNSSNSSTSVGQTPQTATPIQQQQPNPCAQEMQAFLQCAQNNSSDLSLCYGFNEALKECKGRFAMI